MPLSDNWPFIRECQDCGHQQEAKDPRTYVDKAGKEPWRDLKCKKCGADNMDYGSKRPWTEAQKKELADWDAENEE